MSRITIRGVPPYDGTYELDDERAFNTREWRSIKRAGYTPATLSEGFANADPDLYVALTVIAMCRQGKVAKDEVDRVADDLAEAPWDGSTLTVEGDPVEGDESPLVLTSEPERSSPNGSLEKLISSGASSKTGSGQSVRNPPPITLLRSGTS